MTKQDDVAQAAEKHVSAQIEKGVCVEMRESGGNFKEFSRYKVTIHPQTLCAIRENEFVKFHELVEAYLRRAEAKEEGARSMLELLGSDFAGASVEERKRNALNEWRKREKL